MKRPPMDKMNLAGSEAVGCLQALLSAGVVSGQSAKFIKKVVARYMKKVVARYMKALSAAVKESA